MSKRKLGGVGIKKTNNQSIKQKHWVDASFNPDRQNKSQTTFYKQASSPYGFQGIIFI